MRIETHPEHVLNEAVFPLIEKLHCDHASPLVGLKCKTPPMVAPRLLIPSRTQQAPGHAHLRYDFRYVHFCYAHQGELPLDEVLTPALKGKIETFAKQTRPIDFRCDFDAAHLVYVGIFTPEYKHFELFKHLLPRAALEQAWGTGVADG